MKCDRCKKKRSSKYIVFIKRNDPLDVYKKEWNQWLFVAVALISLLFMRRGRWNE